MMKVNRKRVVAIEMDNVDYDMLLDTLGEASKVRSKLFPSLNEKAALLYGSLTAGETWSMTPMGNVRIFQPEMVTDFAEQERKTAEALAIHLKEHEEALNAENE